MEFQLRVPMSVQDQNHPSLTGLLAGSIPWINGQNIRSKINWCWLTKFFTLAVFLQCERSEMEFNMQPNFRKSILWNASMFKWIWERFFEQYIPNPHFTNWSTWNGIVISCSFYQVLLFSFAWSKFQNNPLLRIRLNCSQCSHYCFALSICYFYG